MKSKRLKFFCQDEIEYRNSKTKNHFIYFPILERKNEEIPFYIIKKALKKDLFDRNEGDTIHIYYTIGCDILQYKLINNFNNKNLGIEKWQIVLQMKKGLLFLIGLGRQQKTETRDVK